MEAALAPAWPGRQAVALLQHDENYNSQPNVSACASRNPWPHGAGNRHADLAIDRAPGACGRPVDWVPRQRRSLDDRDIDRRMSIAFAGRDASGPGACSRFPDTLLDAS